MRGLWLVPLLAIACTRDEAPPAAAIKWTCSMHPAYVSDRPGDCPICNMKLVPQRRVESGDAALPPGLHVEADHQKLLGVRREKVEERELGGGLRTTGRLVPDERRVYRVTARFDGFAEALYADFTGKWVRKGEPLVAIYSPALLQAQEELLLARKSAPSLGGAGLPELARSARERLLLLGIDESDLAAIEARGAPARTLWLRAPGSGFIVEKNVVRGARISPERALFEIVDLTRLWVLADVYEHELPSVKVGQAAELTLPYWPGRRWEGKVTFIHPVLDAKTRTARVRVEVQNPGLDLKPEMFGDVLIKRPPRRALTVPDDAVVDTGLRRVVFRFDPAGRLQPVEVRTGARDAGRAEILSGLAAGDEVARGANFLLDSESRLREAVSRMGGAP